MIKIFEYTDFRKFLKDYFEEQKRLHPFYSYQFFSNKVGIGNKGFLYNVINGSKKLAASHVAKLCTAMTLDERSSAYFRNLVAYNQSTSAQEREHYFRLLAADGDTGQTRSLPAQIISQDQYAFYSSWHHSAIRSLLGMFPDKDDVKWVIRRLLKPIKGWDVRRSIQLLLRLGLLRKNSSNRFELSNALVSTDNEAQSIGLLDFYLQHMDLAVDALRNTPRNLRKFEGVTIGVSREGYEKICEEMSAFADKILTIAKNDEHADTVYQCMLQLYPLTKSSPKESRHDECTC